MGNALEWLLPPESLEAEQATLGACLFDAKAATRALALVGHDDFYREAHRVIFRAVEELSARGEPVDVATVGATLRGRNELEGIGGGEYLAALIGTVPTAAHVVRYAQIVADKALLRRMIAHLAAIQSRAFAQPEDVAEFVAAELAGLRDVAANAVRGHGAVPVADLMPALAARLESQITSAPGVSGARTGITTLDKAMGGLAGWGLIVPRADTKHGKSLFAGQAALASARTFRDDGSRRWVLAYVLEGAEEFEERAVAWLAGINKTRLEARGCAMTDEERDRYHGALQEMLGLPMALTSDLADVSAICADVESQALQGRTPGLVVVDHFQRTEGGGEGDNLTQLLSARAKSFAQLAVRMRCPVIVPSQVTVTQRGERTSMHARGIDQEATVVIDLQRGDGTEDPTGYNYGDLWFARTRRQMPWHGRMRWYIDTQTGDAHLYDVHDWKALGRPTAEEDARYV